MLDSFLLYGGLAASVAGTIALIPKRTRRAGRIALAGGVSVAAIALLLPARETRITSRVTKLDERMPVWQFSEKHAIRVNAPPQRVYEAMRAVTADEISLFRTLTTIRRFGRDDGENILNPSKRTPILEVALRSGFDLVADDPPRELVVETVIIHPRAAVAAMNFVITPDGAGSRLTTETRINTTTPSARRRFATYWRFIHPGSDIIRRMWLRAIKTRAER